MVKIREEQIGSINTLDEDGYGIVNANNSRIINTSNPISSNDVATKFYVDNTHSTLAEILSNENDADGYSIFNIDYLTATNGLFTNNLIVDGYTSQTGLIIENQDSVPGGTPPTGYVTIWCKNSDGYIYSTDSNGIDSLLSKVPDEDDYPFYLLLDGTRAMTGDLNLNTNSINNIENISSSYFTTTSNDATFNFGSNNVSIGDGYLKVLGNSLQTYIENDSKLTLSTSELSPSVNLGLDFGNYNNRWGSIYNNGVIDGYNPSGDSYINLVCGAQDSYSTFINFYSADNSNNLGWIQHSTLYGLFTFGVNNANVLSLDGNSLYPSTDKGLELGGSNNRWGNFYNNGNIDGYCDDSNAVLNLRCGSQDSYVSFISFNSADNENNLGWIEYNTLNNSFTFTINNDSKLILNNTALYPASNNGLDLGTSSNFFKDGYISTITANDGYYYNNVTINGKLTVFGLIDPTGLVLDNQSTVPGGAPASGQTTIWIRQSDNKLIYTNSSNIDTVLSTESSYLTVTANDASFDFTTGSNTIVIGDGYVKASGSSLQNYIGSTSKLTLSAGALYPSSNYGLDLGGGTNYWYNAYIGNLYLTGYISGATTIISNYFTTTANDATFNFGSNDVVIGDGYVKASGSTLQTYIGNTSELTLSNSSLYPTTNNGLNLGGSSNYWGDGYITTLFANSGILSGNLSGITTISSSYFTTTANDAIFNFGNNDIIVGDGYIKASNSSLQIYIGNTNETTLTNTAFYPTTDSGLTLGDATHGFTAGYFRNASDFCALYVLSGSNNTSSIQLGNVDDVDEGSISYNNVTNLMGFRANGSNVLYLSSSALYPIADGGADLGITGAYRWNNIYAINTTVTTSDEREKQDILPIDDLVLDAWEDISLVFYRWIDAVNKKGDDARIHSGFISQKIKETFLNHGLDAHRYGLFCYDSWEEQLDSEGNITKPAGDAYGIRISECLAVEAAYQRRRANRIEKRLTRIEKLLNI